MKAPEFIYRSFDGSIRIAKDLHSQDYFLIATPIHTCIKLKDMPTLQCRGVDGNLIHIRDERFSNFSITCESAESTDEYVIMRITTYHSNFAYDSCRIKIYLPENSQEGSSRQ